MIEQRMNENSKYLNKDKEDNSPEKEKNCTK